MVGWANATAYAASKTGLISLTKTLGRELGPEGSSSTRSRPGSWTPRSSTSTPPTPACRPRRSAAATRRTSRIGRIGRPEEIAALAAFLCSEASRAPSSARSCSPTAAPRAAPPSRPAVYSRATAEPRMRGSGSTSRVDAARDPGELRPAVRVGHGPFGDRRPGGELDVAGVERVLDQAAQCLHPRRAAGQERVAGEHEQAADGGASRRARPATARAPCAATRSRCRSRAAAGTRTAPSRRGPSGAAARRSSRRRRAAGRAGRSPSGSSRRSARTRPPARACASSPPTAPPVPGRAHPDASRAPPAPARSPPAPRPRRGRPGCGGCRSGGPTSCPASANPRHRLGIALGRQAGHEERGRQPVLAEQLEQARDPHQRPVGLVGHDHGVVGVAPALREDRRLGVDVEGQHGDGAPTAEPAHSASSRPSPDPALAPGALVLAPLPLLARWAAARGGPPRPACRARP